MGKEEGKKKYIYIYRERAALGSQKRGGNKEKKEEEEKEEKMKKENKGRECIFFPHLIYHRVS